MPHQIGSAEVPRRAVRGEQEGQLLRLQIPSVAYGCLYKRGSRILQIARQPI